MTYRFVLPDGDVREFDDLEEGIQFAAANEVREVGVVFSDGDVHSIQRTGRSEMRPTNPHQELLDSEYLGCTIFGCSNRTECNGPGIEEGLDGDERQYEHWDEEVGEANR